jgi:hypothetical protein
MRRNYSFKVFSAPLRLFDLLNLPRDFKSEVQRVFGGFTARFP